MSQLIIIYYSGISSHQYSWRSASKREGAGEFVIAWCNIVPLWRNKVPFHSISLKLESNSRWCRQYPGFGRFQNGENADSGSYSSGGKGLGYPQRDACCQVSCFVLLSLLYFKLAILQLRHAQGGGRVHPQVRLWFISPSSVISSILKDWPNRKSWQHWTSN